MEYYTINKFSKRVGKSAQTLRNWDKKGILKPNHTSTNGYRYYAEDQIITIFASRLQGKCANKAKRFISEVLKDDKVN